MSVQHHGNLLKLLLKNAGKSQAELGKKLGLGRNWTNQLLQQENIAPLHIIKACKFLKADPLMFGIDPTITDATNKIGVKNTDKQNSVDLKPFMDRLDSLMSQINQRDHIIESQRKSLLEMDKAIVKLTSTVQALTNKLIENELSSPRKGQPS